MPDDAQLILDAMREGKGQREAARQHMGGGGLISQVVASALGQLPTMVDSSTQEGKLMPLPPLFCSSQALMQCRRHVKISAGRSCRCADIVAFLNSAEQPSRLTCQRLSTFDSESRLCICEMLVAPTVAHGS